MTRRRGLVRAHPVASAIGAMAGTAVGAAAGAFAGPNGMIAGAAIGWWVGLLGGGGYGRSSDDARARERWVDDLLLAAIPALGPAREPRALPPHPPAATPPCDHATTAPQHGSPGTPQGEGASEGAAQPRATAENADMPDEPLVSAPEWTFAPDEMAAYREPACEETAVAEPFLPLEWAPAPSWAEVLAEIDPNGPALGELGPSEIDWGDVDVAELDVAELDVAYVDIADVHADVHIDISDFDEHRAPGGAGRFGRPGRTTVPEPAPAPPPQPAGLWYAEPRPADPRHPDPRHPDPRHPDPRHPAPRYSEPRPAESRPSEPPHHAEPRSAEAWAWMAVPTPAPVFPPAPRAPQSVPANGSQTLDARRASGPSDSSSRREGASPFARENGESFALPFRRPRRPPG